MIEFQKSIHDWVTATDKKKKKSAWRSSCILSGRKYVTYNLHISLLFHVQLFLLDWRFCLCNSGVSIKCFAWIQNNLWFIFLGYISVPWSHCPIKTSQVINFFFYTQKWTTDQIQISSSSFSIYMQEKTPLKILRWTNWATGSFLTEGVLTC